MTDELRPLRIVGRVPPGSDLPVGAVYRDASTFHYLVLGKTQRGQRSAMRRLTKGSVNYRESNSPTERCDTCAMFKVPASCDLVKGFIVPQAVCDRWTPIEGSSK